jgi:hypothetical protein
MIQQDHSAGVAMSMSSSARASLAAPFDLEMFLRQCARNPWLTAAILSVATLQQVLGHVNCDTSWFMTFAEKVLAGATPYIDISDPNPPAAFLAYVPAIALARATGLAPEPIVIFLAFAGALLSIGFAGLILKKTGQLRAGETWPALAAASFVLLLVPAFCFAEREHLALILFLPILALCAARASGAKVPFMLVLLAGLGAGLGLAFKPYYAIPLGFAILYVALNRRAWRLLFMPEIFIITIVLGLYGLTIVWFFPAYLTQVLPLAADIYVPARETVFYVLTVPAFIANAALLLLLFAAMRGRFDDPRIGIVCMASIGFLASYLIQSKGWMNHAYPGFALALLAGAFFLFGGNDAAGRRRFALFVFLPVILIAPLLFGAATDFANAEEYPGLTATVSRLGPAHPKIAALAEEPNLGHPLVRQLGGTWIGRQNCLWISYAVKYLLGRGVDDQRRASLLRTQHADEAMFAEDVRYGAPDVVLVETPELEAWARHEPELAGLFDGYRLAGRVNAVSIWLRDERN